MDTSPTHEETPPGPRTRVILAADRLDAALAGSLPCVICGYELKGLSVRGPCPECGTAIRATILYKVDPEAEEFKPIAFPRLLGNGLALWPVAALVSALAAWFIRIADFSASFFGAAVGTGAVPTIVIVAAGVSALAAIPIVRPMDTTPRRHSLAAIIGLICYLPLIWALFHIYQQVDPYLAPPYFEPTPSIDRLAARFVASISLILIIAGLRPCARDLVRRSMALRTGRVDRQTLLGMIITVAITIFGDLLRLVAGMNSAGELTLLSQIGTLLVATGSALFTLGLASACVDSLRIRRAILTPSPSLRMLLGDEPAPVRT